MTTRKAVSAALAATLVGVVFVLGVALRPALVDDPRPVAPLSSVEVGYLQDMIAHHQQAGFSHVGDSVAHAFATQAGILDAAVGHVVDAPGRHVADDDAARWVDRTRPLVYDPDRPPAASKLMVHGVGMEGRTMTIDMIAVGAP